MEPITALLPLRNDLSRGPRNLTFGSTAFHAEPSILVAHQVQQGGNFPHAIIHCVSGVTPSMDSGLIDYLIYTSNFFYKVMYKQHFFHTNHPGSSLITPFTRSRGLRVLNTSPHSLPQQYQRQHVVLEETKVQQARQEACPAPASDREADQFPDFGVNISRHRQLENTSTESDHTTQAASETPKKSTVADVEARQSSVVRSSHASYGVLEIAQLRHHLRSECGNPNVADRGQLVWITAFEEYFRTAIEAKGKGDEASSASSSDLDSNWLPLARGTRASGESA